MDPIFTLLVLSAVSCILCGPSLWMARKLRSEGDAAAYRSLPVVWPAQFISAVGLCLAADAIGLRNPAGYTMAIILGVSVGGAAVLAFWRRGRHHSD